jgi:O-acetylhomoserine (thiol)-lyase
MSSTDRRLSARRELSPLRHTSEQQSADALALEQMRHFSVDPDSPHGAALLELTRHLYAANEAGHELWIKTVEALRTLDRKDRIAFFNAKRFVCFQLAKVLDTLQNPLRRSYQSLTTAGAGVETVRGPYPIFDNVTAIFSATPVITRTATYLYACTEWVEDAFRGKELLHAIYSRLLNPTSISLANYIVDVEAGPLAAEYFAWNFNSGMAAIDATLAHLLGVGDIVLSSRNVYGGTHQLLHDWYGKNSNLDVAVRSFDGFTVEDFSAALSATRAACSERLAAGKQVYVFLESPCNPHGYVLDVPAICRAAHAQGLTVICDCTVGTPFLQPTLRRADPLERPDFVIHSYTKDLTGSGVTTAGVVIARTERMFIAKGDSVAGRGVDGSPRTWRWDETLFWNVYYIKGAFLDSDKAFEVISGMRTLEMRMLQKCVNTILLARTLAAHPLINVHSAAVPSDPNYPLASRLMFLGLAAPLFTLDFEAKPGNARWLDPEIFKRFFDCLEPVFGLQVSLGQTNTVVLCPGLTSHSELSEAALREAGITPTTIRVAVGDEDPRTLLAHLMRAAELAIEPARPGFMRVFPKPEAIDKLYERAYLAVHHRYLKSKRTMTALLN